MDWIKNLVCSDTASWFMVMMMMVSIGISETVAFVVCGIAFVWGMLRMIYTIKDEKKNGKDD